jgi:hypothetical protein
MKEFLLSEEFRRYRKKQVEAIVESIAPDLLSPTHDRVMEITGALRMAQVLLKLPIRLTDDAKTKVAMRKMYKEDINQFEMSFVRGFLEGEEE